MTHFDKMNHCSLGMNWTLYFYFIFLLPTGAKHPVTQTYMYTEIVVSLNGNRFGSLT